MKQCFINNKEKRQSRTASLGHFPIYDVEVGVGVGVGVGIEYFHMASGSVSSHMQRQMIGATETSCAELTAKGLHARVFPVVAGQLVGAGKAPDAAFPGAHIRLLTCEWKSERAKFILRT